MSTPLVVTSTANASKLNTLGMEPVSSCRGDFASLLTRDVETYRRLAKALNLKAE